MWSLVILSTSVSLSGPTLQELDAIERELQSLDEQVIELGRRFELTQIEFARLRSRRARAEIDYRDALAPYRRRLRALARLPSGSRLLLLGRSTSLRDWLRASKTLRLIASIDQRIAKRARHYADKLEHSKLKTQEILGDINTQRLQLRRAQDLLVERRRQRLRLLRMLSRDPKRSVDLRVEARKHVAHWFASSGNEVVKSEPGFTKLCGRLRWPLPQTRQNPRHSSDGSLDIPAKRGIDVQNVAPGQVIFVGWMTGWGLAVIVDHGGGYTSLYSHLRRFHVKTGATIDGGATLGEVGDTGSLVGSQLHFEIRKRGRLIDAVKCLEPRF